jgi:5,10-methylenetetrahydromethanopterin reductase
MLEFWRAGGSTTTLEQVRAAEAEGWDGQMFMDSQCLATDPYVLMGACALATERIRLSPGVTNPLTRHVAVTAAAAASVQALSGGRAVLGIGRGDSALAYLGRAPARVAAFERALVQLQTLLGGGAIAFGGEITGEEAPSLESLSLGDRPAASSLQWLPPGLPKVPLDVAATGPKVIELAAPLAERVTFSVGAAPDRIRWAVDLARAARARRGLPEDGVSFGAQVMVVCHPDHGVALQRATSAVAPLARFQVIQGEVAGPVSDADRANFAAIQQGYDMTRHAKDPETSRIIGGSLSGDFVERFAIVGPPERCAERLLELVGCGLERFVVVGPGFFPEPEGVSGSLFASEVAPAVRTAAGA